MTVEAMILESLELLLVAVIAAAAAAAAAGEPLGVLDSEDALSFRGGRLL
jgi:hypothetical protein